MALIPWYYGAMYFSFIWLLYEIYLLFPYFFYFLFFIFFFFANTYDNVRGKKLIIEDLIKDTIYKTSNDCNFTD